MSCFPLTAFKILYMSFNILSMMYLGVDHFAFILLENVELHEHLMFFIKFGKLSVLYLWILFWWWWCTHAGEGVFLLSPSTTMSMLVHSLISYISLRLCSFS